MGDVSYSEGSLHMGGDMLYLFIYLFIYLLIIIIIIIIIIIC